jgi:hypothetical protein
MYDYLIQYIQVVDDTNYFMNYGLWDNNHTTLKDANENLARINVFKELVVNSLKNKII